jgi:hypothetical protein
MNDSEVMCYAARFPGHAGYGAVSVDLSDHKKTTAKDISEWIKDGATVERVTLEIARAGLQEYIAERKAKKAEQK